nr:hypothetical protein [Tanacetum cinerariifolium]
MYTISGEALHLMFKTSILKLVFMFNHHQSGLVARQSDLLTKGLRFKHHKAFKETHDEICLEYTLSCFLQGTHSGGPIGSHDGGSSQGQEPERSAIAGGNVLSGIMEALRSKHTNLASELQ